MKIFQSIFLRIPKFKKLSGMQELHLSCTCTKHCSTVYTHCAIKTITKPAMHLLLRKLSHLGNALENRFVGKRFKSIKKKGVMSKPKKEQKTFLAVMGKIRQL